VQTRLDRSAESVVILLGGRVDDYPDDDCHRRTVLGGQSHNAG
jgi:hypothetical protein